MYNLSFHDPILYSYSSYGKSEWSSLRRISFRRHNSLPAERPGQVIHIDIVATPTSLGGIEHVLVAVDEKTSYMMVAPMKSKDKTSLLIATQYILRMVNQNGHRCEEFRSDYVRSQSQIVRQRMGHHWHKASKASSVQPCQTC